MKSMSLYEFLHGPVPAPNPLHFSISPALLGVTEFIDDIKKFNEIMDRLFKVTGAIAHYITHPILIWNGFFGGAYVIALILGGVFIVLTVLGWKKGPIALGATGFGFIILKMIDISIGG